MEDDATRLHDIAGKLDHYTPSPAAIELVQRTPILLLVGIAGAGKDTIKHRLIDTGKYHHIVSHTTRAPRDNNGVLEQDGVEYHFVSFGQVASMVKHGQFVEAKVVHRDNVYGTSVAEIKAANNERKVAIADIEVQGVAEYKALSADVLAVFILPPTYEIWEERLRARYGGNHNEAEIRQRMRTAVEELEHAMASDYYVFVVNEDLGKTVKLIDALARDHDAVLDDVEEKALARELVHRIQADLAGKR
ncbi:MAG: hypothetical protein WC498_04375 [Candidatus Saccharimonadales bacterium]